MISYRQFSIFFLAVLLGVCLFNFVIWKLYTEVLLTQKYDGGNTARMGYVAGSKMLRKNYDDLPRRHIEFEDYDGTGRIDVVTLGDSFSNAGGGGRNRFYQDYIATKSNVNVLNIRPFLDMDFFTTIITLCNNGYFDTVKPRYLVLETLESSSIDRFGGILPDLSSSKPIEEVRNLKQHSFAAFQKELSFINNGNAKFVFISLLRLFSPNAFINQVYMEKLNKPFFSVPNSDFLLFLEAEVSYVKKLKQADLIKVNDNMNQVAELLAKKGVKLCFMPCPNKYNLYSGFLVNQSYPRSIFFEELRRLPKKYQLIDTKAILLDALNRGEKDIYFADDTHWSWRASELLFSEVLFTAH